MLTRSAQAGHSMKRVFIVATLVAGSVAAGCARETEDRPSMPDERKVLMDSMPQGPPADSMAAEMERAWEGDSAR
jgi:hypothetical protein